MLYFSCFIAASDMFVGDLSGMGNPTGMKSPIGDGDGENLPPRPGTGMRSGEVLFSRGAKRSIKTRRG
jgi:hypothetical protein